MDYGYLDNPLGGASFASVYGLDSNVLSELRKLGSDGAGNAGPGMGASQSGGGLLSNLGQAGGFSPFAQRFSNWQTTPMQHTASPLAGLLQNPQALNQLFQQRGWGGFNPVNYNPMPEGWSQQSVPNRVTMQSLYGSPPDSKKK